MSPRAWIEKHQIRVELQGRFNPRVRRTRTSIFLRRPDKKRFWFGAFETANLTPDESDAIEHVAVLVQHAEEVTDFEAYLAHHVKNKAAQKGRADLLTKSAFANAQMLSSELLEFLGREAFDDLKKITFERLVRR